MSRAESMKLVKRLRSAGFVVVRTGSGHWKVTSPEGKGPVIMGFSPRAKGRHATMKRLREIGYKED